MTTFVLLHMHQPVTCATYSICEEKKVGTTCIYSNEASLFLGREREREKEGGDDARARGRNKSAYIYFTCRTNSSIDIHTHTEKERERLAGASIVVEAITATTGVAVVAVAVPCRGANSDKPLRFQLSVPDTGPKVLILVIARTTLC